MRPFNVSFISCLLRNNLRSSLQFNPSSKFLTAKYSTRGVLNSLITSVDQDFLKTENFQFFVSQEYDDLFKSLNALKGNQEVIDTIDPYNELRTTTPQLFKIFIDKKFGGIGMDHTNFAYLLERLRSNIHISNLITVNQLLCAQAITKYGSDEQKSQYLPKLSTGQTLGSFCLHELSSGNNIYMIESFGEYCGLTDTFKISATKNWIFNAQFMNMCIVFVKIKNEKGIDCLTAFLKNDPLKDPAVNVCACDNVLNIQNVGDVIFDNVSFSRKDMLGEIGDGFKIAIQLQNSARFAVAASILGIIKDAFSKIFNLKLPSSEFNAKVVKWSSDIFTIESALYFTTNIADDYPMSTFDGEFAALKVQASMTAFEVINGCIDLSRLSGEDESYYINLLDKIRGLDLFLGSSDVLTYFIGSMAVQHNLPLLKEDILKMQNIEDNFMWKLKFQNNLVCPTTLKECSIDQNANAVSKFLNFLKHEIVLSLSTYGFNSPNEDAMNVRIGQCLIASYHLLAVIGHYNLLDKTVLSNETKLLIKRSMDDLRHEIVDDLGGGYNRLSLNVNNIKNHAISKIVTKNSVHGIESAFTRNW